MDRARRLFVVNTSAASLSFAGAVLSAKVLGAEGYVMYGLAVSYASFETLLVLAPLRISASRLSAEIDRDQKRMIRGMVVIAGFLTALPIIALSMLFGAPDSGYWALVLSGTIAVVIATEFSDLAAWQALSAEHLKAYVALRIAPRAIVLICALIAITKPPEFRLAVFAVAALALSATLVTVTGASVIPVLHGKLSFARIAEYSWPNALAGVFSWLFLLVPRMALEAADDVYAAAGVILLMQIVGTGAAIATATLIQSFLPQCQQEFRKNPIRALQQTHIRAIAASRLLGALFLIGAGIAFAAETVWEKLGAMLGVRLQVIDILLIGISVTLYSVSQIYRTAGDVAGKFSHYLVPTAIYSLCGVIGVAYFGMGDPTTTCAMLCVAESVQLVVILAANKRIKHIYAIA